MRSFTARVLSIIRCRARRRKRLQAYALQTYMMAHPGKNCSLWATEFSQHDEWNFNEELEWNLLQYPEHQMAQTFFKKLNAFYLGRSELWGDRFSWEGFSWISNDDDSQSAVIAFRRFDREGNELIAVQFPAGPPRELLHQKVRGRLRRGVYLDAAELATLRTATTSAPWMKLMRTALSQSISATLPENTVFFLRRKRKAAKACLKIYATTTARPAAKRQRHKSRKESPDSFYETTYGRGGKMPERSNLPERIISHVT